MLNHYSNPSHIFRLVLGTAQLGLPYGIANKTGQPNQNIATAIIHEAWNQGIRQFDTAQGYGTSEEVLGKAISKLGISSETKIITKFDPNLDHLDASVLSNTLNQSLERLGVSSLFGIMLHREEMLSLWDKGLGKILQAFVLSGRVEKIGIDRARFMLDLKNKGIQTQVHYIPVHLQTFYQKNFGTKRSDCPTAEQYYQKCLSIPLYPAMTDLDIKKVTHEIKNIIKGSI